MNGITRRFTCKKCKEEQTHNIGITTIYKINNLNMEFIQRKCTKCGELHYIASSGYILDELTKAAKEAAFEEMVYLLGTSQRAKEMFMRGANFILAKEAVLTQEEVSECEDLGTCCY